MLRLSATACVLAALLTGVAHADNEPLLIKRAVELRQAAGENSASLMALPAQSQVTRLGLHQGPWLQVKAANGSVGWVHMFDVGSSAAIAATTAPSTSSNAATGALRSLSNFFGGSSSQPKTAAATSTIGIRGLGAEDISSAQPDVAALVQAEGLRLDATQARLFAQDAQLSARAVDALPEPAAPGEKAANETQGSKR
jgi:hypothetical protein